MNASVLSFLNLVSGSLNLGGLQAQLEQFFTRYGPELAMNVLAAAVMLVVGRWGAKLAARMLDKILARAHVDETLAKFVCRLAHALILTVVVVAALDRIGFNTTSVAAILAAAGLAEGMALQGSLSNFAAGVMLIIFRPCRVGDFVALGGVTGTVEEINLFNTFLRTADNLEVIIPNGTVTSGIITNYSAKKSRRIDLVVNAGYDDDLQAVKQFLEDLLASDPRILKEPEPVVAVHELAEKSVNFVVRPWVTNPDYWTVRWDLTERIKVGFDERGFQFPFAPRSPHVHAAPSPESDRQTASSLSPLRSKEPSGLRALRSSIMPRRVAS